MEYKHYPVMQKEVMDALAIKPDGVYCDCTLGGGGHSRLILNNLSEQGRLVSIDRDIAAIENARQSINDNRLLLVKDNYINIDNAIKDNGFTAVDGILMDLGVSSYQLDNADRGFSYMRDAPLDMRMDESQRITAYDIVNGYEENELVRILFEYGEERFARRIARRITAERQNNPIQSTAELAAIIDSAIQPKSKKEGGHPAKRSFQALRIEVNGELDAVGQAIEKGVSLLNEGGRIAVISFHSLEDRIVKTVFNRLYSPCTCPRDFPVCTCGKKPLVKIINKKVITPSEEELRENTRSHSAKLRVAEKITG